jgi:hypothetical protein
MAASSSALGGLGPDLPPPFAAGRHTAGASTSRDTAISSDLLGDHHSLDTLDGGQSRPLPNGRSYNGVATTEAGSKDESPLDWYVEGPGRRVGYDDMTAIDWIFEYTKERQRLRILRSGAEGLLGYAQELLDASQVWLVLIATGIAAGVLAAGIDVASDWLGDLKTGYCSAGPGGGRFYLNRGFCCWGLEGRFRLAASWHRRVVADM